VRRAIAAVTGALVLAGAGYVTADVLDVAPGVLTWDDGSWHANAGGPAARPTAGQVLLPHLPPDGEPLAPPGVDNPLPSKAGLQKRLDALVADPWLRPSAGVVVRDGLTGALLYAHEATRPRLAASTQKLLAAAAVVTDLDVHRTLDTKVVRGTRDDEVVIVAGGDTVLGRGAGNPSRVGGRAGLADLAGQVATSLIAGGTARATVSVDLSYAAGPVYPATWEMADVAAGATQGVHMIGFDDQRPRIGHASPADPALEVAEAFVAQLDSLGINARLAPRKQWASTRAGTDELGVVHSAPIGDVLALALDESDNAMTEGLCRIGAVESGVKGDFRSTANHVVARLRQLGVDTSGVSLRDCSGLSRGQRTPATAIASVLTLGTTGRSAALQDLVAKLPVAGLTGTLTDRFTDGRAKGVAGVPRAKTGTLTGTSGVAGTTVDADGRLLTFVAIADRVPDSVGTLAARAALDRFVAGLTQCGCR
jgi:D-alanyl-D-alanine carboxypeptidase/D-alanyl-D-alanine-endopeptidase (penicillin-binding protein 4)